MCNECEEIIAKEDCFTPCEKSVDASCVFYNVENQPSQNLNFLGIKGSVSFNHLLKRIDEKFANSLATAFDKFNLYDLNQDKEIKTLKQFVEVISEKIQLLFSKDVFTNNRINTLEQRINMLEVQITALTNPQISSAVLSVDSTDTIFEVMSKYKTFLEIHNQISSPSIETVDTKTIILHPSGTKNHKLSADVNISLKEGNRVVNNDGLYVGDPSYSSFLDAINTNEVLKKKFLGIVKLANPNQIFTIQNKSEDSEIVNFISSENNQEQTVTVGPGQIKNISKVKEILSTPHSQLVITNKGINNGLSELC